MKYILTIIICAISIFIIFNNSFKKVPIKNNENNTKEPEKKPAEDVSIDYNKYKVNELGNIPIMMYHVIVDIKKDTYNVDKGGYTRTKDGLINDLEFYYKNNYRMIRLIDYINGNINTKLGFSPIVLTFDDGNKDNIRVLGRDEKGNLIIDPNSAVGILEGFKKKYRDYNITATFFVNKGLFGQREYNNEILNWLVDNGYDIGNHTSNHLHLDRISENKVQEEIATLYDKLDEIIPNKYVKIIALPFGKPSGKNHKNFKYAIKSEYNNKEYKSEGVLRVGWDSNESPYSKNFDPHFIKRARAYDNNGRDFDIKMVFNLLEKTRYISDGNSSTIVINNKHNLRENLNKKVILYE